MFSFEKTLLLFLLILVFTGCREDTTQHRDCDYQLPYDRTKAATCDALPTEFCLSEDQQGCVPVDDDLSYASIPELQTAFEDGQISCVWLVSTLLGQITATNLLMDDDPPLNAIAQLNRQAIDQARHIDRVHTCSQDLVGPLHCVPFLVKANVATTDTEVSNGSLMFAGLRFPADAEIVELLRGYGAVLLGTATMDEFARGVRGVANLHGRTANAYDRRLNSGGSSSGSAVSVAAGFSTFSVGTDNCASLTLPAGINGLTTIRTSHGLMSSHGIFPSNPLSLTIGPITRSAEDLAIVLDSMVPLDATCSQGPQFQKALQDSHLPDARIGILRDLGEEASAQRRFLFNDDEELEVLYEAFWAQLRELGAVVVDELALEDFSTVRRSSGNGYDSRVFVEKSQGTSINQACAAGLFSFSVFEDVNRCLNFYRQSRVERDAALASGERRYLANRAKVESFMDQHDVDFLVYPVDSGGVARAGYRTNCVLGSVTGLPGVVFPVGYNRQGLPLSMTITGRYGSDAALVAMAHEYQQAFADFAPPPVIRGDPGAALLDLEGHNQLVRRLGEESFERYLREEPSRVLTPARFADIARDVYRAASVEALIIAGESDP